MNKKIAKPIENNGLNDSCVSPTGIQSTASLNFLLLVFVCEQKSRDVSPSKTDL
jgi:hypothetical protein